MVEAAGDGLHDRLTVGWHLTKAWDANLFAPSLDSSITDISSHRAEGSRPTSSQWMTRRARSSVICASL